MNTWSIGIEGTTNLLVHTALQAIENNEGVLFIDPNGDGATTLLSQCPKRRTDDVLLIDPVTNPVGWNILYNVKDEDRPLYATLIRDTIKSLSNYVSATPVMDRVLYNTIACLLYRPGSSLLDIERMLTDKDFRDSVLGHVSDTYLVDKWAYWEKKQKRDYDTMIASSENKGGEFSEDPRIRRILGTQTTFDLRAHLFNSGVTVLRLPQGQLGVSRSTSFGSLFLANVLSIIQQRKIHTPLTIYVIDCHLFDTPVLRQLLSVGRKYGVSMYLSNQYLNQLSEPLLYSILGNTEQRYMFQLGIEDSERLHRTIPRDNNLPKLHELQNEMIVFDGAIRTEKPPKPVCKGRRLKTVERQSHRQYGI